jgi:glycosyltransferase involved in cell wall biosynthesis
MRIIMLSWEYPPKIVGGIARHVYELGHALAEEDIEVHVITAEFPGAPAYERQHDQLHVYRVPVIEHANDFVHWVQLLNRSMQAKAEELLNGWLQGGKPFKSRPFADGVILHAHDWLAHYSGAYLKHAYRLPLIATIHATEYGRNNGLHNDLQRYIASVEWQLSYEAWRVICCSWYMKGEVEFALQTPSDKIVVIPNGVDATKFEFKFDEAERQAFRNNYAAPDEKILFFVGRMVREKGAHILLEALPKVRVVYPKVKLLIVGGGYRDHLVQLANWLGIAPHVYFTGFVPDDVLLRIYRIADVAVFPSLYEPFGIVALEAMAARIPVVVSDAGGLKEVVEHNVTGIVTWLNNSDSLAWGILEVLQNPDRAQEMVKEAYRRVKTIYNWKRIARQTIEQYRQVWSEYRKSDW